MEKFTQIIKELFVRDLRTSPMETGIFFSIVFGFFGILVIANYMKRRKEMKEIVLIQRQKWEHLCEKFKLTREEVSFLEKAASYLKAPEKKYLLLVDYQVLRNAFTVLSEHDETDDGLVASIYKKTGLQGTDKKTPSIPSQRRMSARRTVNITAKLAPIEHTAAHIEARMYNISAGGCKTENPDGRFRTGEDIKVSFIIHEKEYKNIPSEVVRTSKNGRILHISFGHVKKQTHIPNSI